MATTVCAFLASAWIRRLFQILALFTGVLASVHFINDRHDETVLQLTRCQIISHDVSMQSCSQRRTFLSFYTCFRGEWVARYTLSDGKQFYTHHSEQSPTGFGRAMLGLNPVSAKQSFDRTGSTIIEQWTVVSDRDGYGSQHSPEEASRWLQKNYPLATTVPCWADKETARYDAPNSSLYLALMLAAFMVYVLAF